MLHHSGLGASIAKLVFYVDLLKGSTGIFANEDVQIAETRIVYIQLLEAGVSVTALNLPPLWGLSSSTALHIVRSVQSLHSLQSVFSAHSQRSGSATSKDARANAGRTQDAQAIDPESLRFTASATHPEGSVKHGSEKAELEQNHIHVQRDVEIIRHEEEHE